MEYKVDKSRLTLTQSQYSYLKDSILKSANLDARHLFYHVLDRTWVNMKMNKPEPLKIYIDYKALASNFPKCNTQKNTYLRGYLIAGNYSEKEGKCRYFSISKDILSLLNELEIVDRTSNYKLVNPFSARSYRPRVKSSSKYDENNNPIQQLIYNSISKLSGCMPNIDDVSKYLLEENSKTNLLESQRLVQDLQCFRTITSQQVSNSEGIFTYQPVYKQTSTGRVTEIGGGLQSCSKTMRYLALQNIPNIHSYDVVSSMPCALIQLFEETNPLLKLFDEPISTDWLTEYLSRPKEKYADEANLTIDQWKHSFYAFCCGASLPQLSEESFAKSNRYSITSNIPTYDSYTKFRKILLPLAKERCKWYNSFNLTKKIKNACGLFIDVPQLVTENISIKQHNELCPKDYQKPHNINGKITAHLCQGLEASFIHNLTILSSTYNYKPFVNLHDALIVQGTIPPEAINTARELSTFYRATLKVVDL